MTRAHYHRFDHYHSGAADDLRFYRTRSILHDPCRCDETTDVVYILTAAEYQALRDAENAHAYRQAQGAINAP